MAPHSDGEGGGPWPAAGRGAELLLRREAPRLLALRQVLRELADRVGMELGRVVRQLLRRQYEPLRREGQHPSGGGRFRRICELYPPGVMHPELRAVREMRHCQQPPAALAHATVGAGGGGDRSDWSAIVSRRTCAFAAGVRDAAWARAGAAGTAGAGAAGELAGGDRRHALVRVPAAHRWLIP
jgi:hypothetical protein